MPQILKSESWSLWSPLLFVYSLFYVWNLSSVWTFLWSGVRQWCVVSPKVSFSLALPSVFVPLCTSNHYYLYLSIWSMDSSGSPFVPKFPLFVLHKCGVSSITLEFWKNNQTREPILGVNSNVGVIHCIYCQLFQIQIPSKTMHNYPTFPEQSTGLACWFDLTAVQMSECLCPAISWTVTVL